MAVAVGALISPTPAFALSNAARTYVEARAAAIEGNHLRSAELFSQLAAAGSADQAIAKEALSQAISAGDMKLALRLARGLPAANTPIEGRMLLVADALRSNDANRAISVLQGGSDAGDISFLSPFVQAWAAADAKDLPKSLAALDAIPKSNMLAGLVPEHRALILAKLGRSVEAQPYVDQALKVAGGREPRLRLALSDAYRTAGDRARSQAVLQGLGPEFSRSAEKVLLGKPGGVRIDNARRAFSEVLVVLSAELNRLRNEKLPVSLTQVARYAAPDNSAASVMLGLTLASRDRVDEGIAALRTVRDDDPLYGQARDAEVRALVNAKRKEEALRVAQRALDSGGGGVGDYARLGDVLSSMSRNPEAASAYARAIQLLGPSGRAEDRWPLLMLQASALQDSNRWPEARDLLNQALAIAPDQAVLLNFLGYAKLERGEDLNGAEAMIRKASALAPDDAAITDSLGWAIYKRGRLPEAIEILSRAAKGDPAEAEIHEHLGDALYQAGNRFEARYAWAAALQTAEDEVATRLKAKIETGLTPATAAP